MKKMLLLFTLLVCNSISSATNHEEYSLVFFYVGNPLPSYVTVGIANARLFNTNCPIILLTNTDSIKKSPIILNEIKKYNVTVINCDELKKSMEHAIFDTVCSKRKIHGYWKYTTERFLYIADAMEQYQWSNVFQVECDVMVYINLANYLHILIENDTNIAAPFQNDYLASVSFTYFANAKVIDKFIQWILRAIDCQCPETDMYLLASYKNHMSQEVAYLPTLSKDVIRRTIVTNLRHEGASTPWRYWNNIEQWDSIFDNDGIGTFLETNQWVFNQAYFNPMWYDKIEWELDALNRRIPYIYCQHYKYRINTLHIASKNLYKYSSCPTKKWWCNSNTDSDSISPNFPSQRLLGYVCTEEE